MSFRIDSEQENNPGFIAGLGYTAGSRSAREFGWARNLKKNGAEPEQQAYKISCVMTRIWEEHLWKIMPQVVRDDFDKLAKELKGLAMDGGPGASEDGILYYTMDYDGESKKFTTTRNPPATGVCAANYSR